MSHLIDAADLALLADFGPQGMPFVIVGTFFGQRTVRGAADSYTEAKAYAAGLHDDEAPQIYRWSGDCWKRTH